MTDTPVPARCNAVLPAATGETDDLHCERQQHNTGRHRDVDLLWLDDDPDSIITIGELLEADDDAQTAAVAALDVLAGWLATNMPDTVHDGERPVDTAIRVLATFHLVAVTTTRSVAQHIVAPLVDALRHAGIDILPDGITIPATKKEPR